MNKNINVLMITGVYFPEFNGAVRQCGQLISELSHTVKFEVLCATNQKNEIGEKFRDRVLITKVFMNRISFFQYFFNLLNFYRILFLKLKFFDIVHIHGFSWRNAGVILIAVLLRKKIILKMTSFGQDDPESIKKKSRILWYIFNLCDFFIGISPVFSESCSNSGISKDKYRLIPNGVSLNIFRPISLERKIKFKENFGYKQHDKIILFVGHFSPEKNPLFVYESWIKFYEINNNAKLIFIGINSDHFEVDDSIFIKINDDLAKRGLSDHVKFIQKTDFVQDYMQFADVFFMASEREGLPNVLLEAMACGLPCIVKIIPGITDWIVQDGQSGLLFDKNDSVNVANLINLLVNDILLRQKIINNASKFISENFSSNSTSQKILKTYSEAAN